MKAQIEGPGSISLETKNDTLHIDTCDNNVISVEGKRGIFKLYERKGEFEIAHEGRVVWSSYLPDENDAWKDWGPATEPSK